MRMANEPDGTVVAAQLISLLAPELAQTNYGLSEMTIELDCKNLAERTPARISVIADIRRIYKEEGITYDLVPNKRCPFDFKKIQGAYINDGDGASILINKNLPKDPRVFTMAHELKHHCEDADKGGIICSGGEDSLVEIPTHLRCEIPAHSLDL